MKTAVALATTSAATLFLLIAATYFRKSDRLEKENLVLWDQVTRFEAYFKDRAAEDELRARSAILN